MTKQLLARFCLAICVASPAALWAWPQDSSAPPQAQTPPSPEARQIMSDSDAKINAILTPDQQTQYAQIEEQMREQMKQRMQEKKAAGAT